MRNNIIYTLLLVSGLLSLSGCKDTLDTHPTEVFTDDMVWGNKLSADAFVYNTYNNIIPSAGLAGSGSCIDWASRTPNSVKSSQVGGDGWEAVVSESDIEPSWNFGAWRFGELRSANLIIDKATHSSSLSDPEKNELIAHGRLLRGLIFFEQTRRMGRYVPIKEVLNSADTLKCKIPMTKDLAESYQVLMEDLKYAAENLPAQAPHGIANKWAAKVILSRAALQAYAYTMDRSYIDLAEQTAQDVIDNSKIALTSNYGGMFNETDAYNKEILWGYYRVNTNTSFGGITELMRTFPNCSGGDQDNSMSPIKYPSGKNIFECWAVHFPTQDMVDQYLVTDASTGNAMNWWETSQYKENVTIMDPNTITEAGQIDSYNQKNGSERRIPTPNDLTGHKVGYPAFLRYVELKPTSTKTISELMYEGRDARFASSIVYDGTTWLGFKVELNLGGNLSQGVRDKEDGGWFNTTTGYYWRKNSVEKPDPRAFISCKTDFHYCIARLGEAYMNLAEAKLLKNDVAGAVEALNATRTTHGKIAPSEANTIGDAWKDYIRERRVEMVNESADIYFSYLRWGKYGGEANDGRQPGDIIKALDSPVYKIEINRDRTKMIVCQHTLMNTANRNFTTKRYLFPIAKGFLDQREAYGLDHEQNPGW